MMEAGIMVQFQPPGESPPPPPECKADDVFVGDDGRLGGHPYRESARSEIPPPAGPSSANDELSHVRLRPPHLPRRSWLAAAWAWLRDRL